jgi:hypothetical protein
VRKRAAEEVEAKGRLPQAGQPAAEMRVHLNQYRTDRRAIIAGNDGRPPFGDDAPL